MKERKRISHATGRVSYSQSGSGDRSSFCLVMGVLALLVLAAPGDAYDCGDNLHPNDAGYKAMADSIDLGLLLARSARE